MSTILNKCYAEQDSRIAEILNQLFINEQLTNLDKYEYDPLICGHRLFFSSYYSLPDFMKEFFAKEHEDLISFEKFVEDYPKNRLYYELLKSMEGVK